MRFLFKFLFSLSSFSPCILFFLIKNEIVFINQFPDFCNYLIYALSCFLFFFLLFTILVEYKNKSDSIQIKSITPIDFNIIPMYLGLFIISLNLDNSCGSYLILALVFMLFFLVERNRSLNLFFLFLRFRFYQIEIEGQINVFYISKEKDIKEKSEEDGLIRINNFTFLKIDSKKQK